MALTLRDILALQNIDAALALNGADAVEQVRHDNSIKGVVMDIRMPGMNGVEALKEIKKIQPDMLVIMMTAYAESELAVEAMNSEAEAVLKKPLNIPELLKLIKVTM